MFIYVLFNYVKYAIFSLGRVNSQVTVSFPQNQGKKSEISTQLSLDLYLCPNRLHNQSNKIPELNTQMSLFPYICHHKGQNQDMNFQAFST